MKSFTFGSIPRVISLFRQLHKLLGAFVWDQSGIRIIGKMQFSVGLAALPIPEYLDFHSGYSAPRSRIGNNYSPKAK